MALRSINNIVQTFGDPNATTNFDGHKGFYVEPPTPPARLGESSLNAASSAQAIMDDWGGDGNGYYWIQTTGMASPKELWCDMGHSITGRGYMRFWWYGTWYTGDGYTEQQSDFDQQAQFAIADISNINKNAKHGRGRVPAGFNWTSLLVRGRHPGQGNTGNNHYVYWDNFNGVGANFKNAAQSGTTSRTSNGTRWVPTGRSTDYNFVDPLTSNQNCDSFYYDNNGGTYASFGLDDDTGWHLTAFAAGYEASGTHGIDFVSNQNGVTGANAGLCLLFR
tara:strand:- start:43 stop:876 length:834 start_codon:yes stop_codon:yes gene_type:complete